jgi:hypothetical protein
MYVIYNFHFLSNLLNLHPKNPNILIWFVLLVIFFISVCRLAADLVLVEANFIF